METNMQGNRDKIRVAVIGSGAVTEIRYLPAAARCPNLLVTHVIDVDPDRARAVADRFKIPCACSDYHEVFGSVNAVIVATPPRTHAEIAIDCLRNGLHVLCEKPLATNSNEVKAMIRTSEATRTHLAVGMTRRLSWSFELLKGWIKQGLLGKIQRFEVEEGQEFAWPLRTGHLFQSGGLGGVILDTGTHLFDLLLWIFGSDAVEVQSCVTDDWGGVEANTVVTLTLHGPFEEFWGPVTGVIEMSFTRRLGNYLKIVGEKGTLETSSYGSNEVSFYPEIGTPGPVTLKPRENRSIDPIEGFAKQLCNFIDSLSADGTRKYVSADQALLTMQLVEACHREKRRVAQSWEAMHLRHFFGESAR